MRKAPKDGYLFEAKKKYRADIYGTSSQQFKKLGISPASVHLAFMPSAEGREIEVAQSYGFKRTKMHIIDENPAICAHLTRRFPGITTYGVTVDRALDRMVKDGVTLNMANFDFTGNVHGLWKTLCKIGDGDVKAPFAYRHLLFITLFRGRESNWEELTQMCREYRDIWFPDLQNQPMNGDQVRYTMIKLSLDLPGIWHSYVDVPQQYKSKRNTTSLLYFKVVRHAVGICFCNACRRKDKVNRSASENEKIGEKVKEWRQAHDAAEQGEVTA